MPTNRVTWVPLTAEDLRALGACRAEVAVFARTFPHGATPDDVSVAVAAGLSVEWLVDELGAGEVYQQAVAEARAAYQQATAPARAPAWAAYVQATATAQYEALASVWPVWEGGA